MPALPRRVALLPALVACLLLALDASAQAPIAEYEAKAEFLERFTRFIEWPAEALPEDPAAPFVLGVLGRDPFGRYLDQMAASRRIKGRPVQVRRWDSLDEVRGCHLLFIASSEKRDLARIVARLGARPVLTVADTPGFADSGVLINLVSEDERIGFEINEAAVRRSGLSFSSKLLRMARRVGP